MSLFEGIKTVEEESPDFYLFEPFDIQERPQWVMDLAQKDGIDLLEPELVRVLGTAPRPFQSGMFLDEVFLQVATAATSIGKAQDDDSLVATPTGFKRMGDIVVGDAVCHPSGGVSRVMGVYPQGEREMFRVTMDDGSSCRCDREHLWLILEKRRTLERRSSRAGLLANENFNKWRVVSLGDIMELAGVGAPEQWHRVRFPLFIPPEFYRQGTRLLSPYIMGALLGDGSFRGKTLTFTSHPDDAEIVNRISSELPHEVSIRLLGKRGGYAYSITRNNQRTKKRNPAVQAISRFGLWGKYSHEKFVPDAYKLASSEDRLAVLQGLMDTDGYVCDGASGSDFTSTSKRLAEDVAWLARSLGGKAWLGTKKCHYRDENGNKVKCLDAWLVRINHLNPFYLKRKFNRVAESKRTPHKILRGIEPIGKRPARCIRVDAPDGLYLTDDFIVTHNSLPWLIDCGIQLSHEIPFSLRHPKGEPTGVKRFCNFDNEKNFERTLWNIKRWGRFDKETGEKLDHPDIDFDKRTILAEELKQPWDCGEVIGVGEYPKAKLAPAGSMIWICTTAKAWDFFWWRRLAGREKRILPPHIFDTKRGVDGFSMKDNKAYLRNGCEIVGLTYEMGPDRGEAERVWRAILDEEPPDPRWMPALRTHAKTIGVSATPYNGVTWFTENIVMGKQSSEKRVYHACSYDSPYQTMQMIDKTRMDSKPWEIRARIWGLAGDQVGEPYYDRVKIQGWMDRHIDVSTKVVLTPQKSFAVLGQHHEYASLLHTPILAAEVDKVDERNVLEVFEEPMPGCAYWVPCDWGMGSKTSEEIKNAPHRANRNALCVFKETGEKTRPALVAAMRSTLETTDFAMLCLFVCRWYNNALFCPEARGKDAGAGIAVTRDWPFFYKMIVVSDATRREKEMLGFDTNERTRPILFNLVETWIKEHETDHYCEIPHLPTLKELAECVIGKGGRPDHPKRGTLDSVIPFGIGLYVWEHAKDQIRDNSMFSNSEEKKVDPREEIVETRPMIGTKRGLDARQRMKQRKPSRNIRLTGAYGR